MERSERLKNSLSVILLLLACFTLARTFVPTNANTSPFDEFVYIDYLAKSSSQFGIKVGEETGAFARNELACRSVWPGDHVWGEGCESGNTNSDNAYPWAGKSTAYLYPPTYFVLTRMLAQPFVSVGLPLVTSARYVAMFWVFLGLSLLYFSAVRIGISRKVSLGVLLLLLSTPATYWAGTYITPDNMAYLVAGLGCYVAVRVLRNEISPLWAIGYGLLAVALKPIFIVAPIILFLTMIIASISSDETLKYHLRIKNYRTKLLSGFSGVVAGGAFTIVWGKFLKATAVAPEISQGDLIPFSFTRYIADSFIFLGQTSSYGLPVGSSFEFSGKFVDLLLFVGISAAAITAAKRKSHDSIFQASLLMSLLAAPTITLLWQISNGFPGNTIPLGSRYGIILVGFWVLATANSFDAFSPMRKATYLLGISTFALVNLFPAKFLHGPSDRTDNFIVMVPFLIVLAVTTYVLRESKQLETSS